MTEDGHTFNSARHALLEAFVAELNLPLYQVVKLYNTDDEFKRRIDLAAMDIASPRSDAIH